MFRSSVVRCFSTSTVLLKQRRLPVKRLIVPVEQRAEEKKREQQMKRQEAQRKFQQRTTPQKREKKQSQLPVLETFSKDILHKGENIVNKITSFSELKLLPEVRDAVVAQISKETVLRADNFENKLPQELTITPTPIQTIAIHRMSRQLMERNVKLYTLAAETGSGKTWAYLSPLLDFLKQQEHLEDWETMQHKSIVRSVILLPTHELVDQVYASVQGLEASLGLKSFRWGHKESHMDFIEAFKGRIDILVTTPGKIASVDQIHAISRPEHLFKAVRFLVVDEADTLMDRSFVELTHSTLVKMPMLTRLVLCSATVSSTYSAALEKLFPSTETHLLVSPRTHTTPKSVKYTVIDSEVAPYQGSKLKALAQALYAVHRDGTEKLHEKRCVVFVNSKHDALAVAKKLREVYGHDAYSLTGEDSPDERAEKIAAFVQPPRPLEELKEEAKEDAEEESVLIPGSNITLTKKTGDQSYKKMKVLVTTDLAARGINFFAVRNVVLYDSPNTSVDLVHRIGRTGRMGQSGRVIVITDKKTKPWVKALVKKNKK